MSKLEMTTEGETFIVAKRRFEAPPEPDAETRKAMLSSGMERGMEASYTRLERLSNWRAAS